MPGQPEIIATRKINQLPSTIDHMSAIHLLERFRFGHGHGIYATRQMNESYSRKQNET
jgi:hypothetical protein